MWESLNNPMDAEELVVFKNLPPCPTNEYEFNIPELPNNRVLTDRKFLIAFLVNVVFLFPFLIYTLVNSDTDRYFGYGYDPCGNVCGKENCYYFKYECSGKNFTLEKYLQFDEQIQGGDYGELITPRHCVKECKPGYVPKLSRCMLISEEEEIAKEDSVVSEYLSKNAWKLTLACFLSLITTVVMVILFKTATAVVVWGILGAALISGAILLGRLWYIACVSSGGNESFVKLCITLSVLWLVLFFVMVFLYKKIHLIIQLLKEATKAAFDMPKLLFFSILSFSAQLLIYIALVATSAYMFSAGTLTTLQGDFLYYKPNAVMIFTLVLNCWTAYWISQFIIGFQYMTTAGAVSQWYFSKEKKNLDSPILTSASVVFKFHLGSIAFGSLIITLMAIIRAIVNTFSKKKSLKSCIESVMKGIDTVCYLSKNAYVMTAMHGQPFYKSGKRAAKIIQENAVNVAAVNFIGDFVLVMAQVLIVVISMLITLGLLQGDDSGGANTIYIIVFIVSTGLALTSFSIFETCIDTIFLCFCEDSILNDGITRPYAMSRDLIEFVENSKKADRDKKN